MIGFFCLRLSKKLNSTFSSFSSSTPIRLTNANNYDNRLVLRVNGVSENLFLLKEILPLIRVVYPQVVRSTAIFRIFYTTWLLCAEHLSGPFTRVELFGSRPDSGDYFLLVYSFSSFVSHSIRPTCSARTFLFPASVNGFRLCLIHRRNNSIRTFKLNSHVRAKSFWSNKGWPILFNASSKTYT